MKHNHQSCIHTHIQGGPQAQCPWPFPLAALLSERIWSSSWLLKVWPKIIIHRKSAFFQFSIIFLLIQLSLCIRKVNMSVSTRNVSINHTPWKYFYLSWLTFTIIQTNTFAPIEINHIGSFVPKKIDKQFVFYLWEWHFYGCFCFVAQMSVNRSLFPEWTTGSNSKLLRNIMVTHILGHQGSNFLTQRNFHGRQLHSIWQRIELDNYLEVYLPSIWTFKTYLA